MRESTVILLKAVVIAGAAAVLLLTSSCVQKQAENGVEKAINILTISAGCNHSLALCEDGSVWAWGENRGGQLGNGEGGELKGKEVLPVRVKKPKGMGKVVSISTGGFHSLALCEDGSVWAWGYNKYGQLGNGGVRDDKELLPVRVKKPKGIGKAVSISAGGNHSLALCEDGSVWAWGYNKYGQLGNEKAGENEEEHSPVRVETPKGMGKVTSISAGGDHSLALCENGSVWAW